MGIESFEYEERSGELGDLYYTIKLYEWKDILPKKIVLPKKEKKPAKTKEPVRAGKPEKKSKTYTVKKGHMSVEYREEILWQGKRLYKNL